MWKKYKLKDLTTKIGSGATPTGGGNAYKLEGISLIRSQNILDFKFSYDGLAFIDDEQADGLKNVIVNENDVLLNITGDSVARVCKVPKEILPARVNQHVAIIRADANKTTPNYLLYYLQANKEFLLSISEIGGTRNALTKAMIENLDFKIPPLPEQKLISETLSSLDDKIDLLHRQNKTLEALAETLFRQWFVEEAEEESVKLGDVVKTSSGGTPSRAVDEYYLNGTIKWVKSKELQGGFIFETEEMITDEAVKKSSAKLFPANTILIAMYGATVGEYAVLAEPATCNQAICGLIPNENYPYIFLFILTKYNKENLIGLAGGSAQQNISQELIKEIQIPKSINKIKEYHSQVEPMFQKIKSNTKQIKTLTHLRDTLLPKLMSGEIRLNCDLCD